MKNVTITIDDALHRKARVYAAEQGTSLSALVKSYLEGLTDAPSSEYNGVREMPMTFKAEPASHHPAALGPKAPSLASVPNPDNAPYFVNGQWVFTKDGKPRKPGAMKHMWVANDFDEWPNGFLEALYGDDTPASNTWWLNANDVLKKPSEK